MATNNSTKRKTTRRTTSRKSGKSSKRSRLSITSVIWFLLVTAIIGLTARYLMAKPTTTVEAPTGVYGNLESVVTNPTLKEQLIKYRGMTVSFNSDHHIPNWVAWELTATETEGDIPRANNFVNDTDVTGCPDPWDYSYSGYDRGHMAPAGDMKWDSQAMQQSFMLTNICPQAKSLNTGAWKRLEEKCRQRAVADSAIVIVCGPVLTDSIREHIGDTRVSVPKRFFKVVLSPYTNPPRAIGFIMPNASFKGGMQVAAVSIDEVEAATGHDFFASLPDSLEERLESQCKFNQWSNIPKKR